MKKSASENSSLYERLWGCFFAIAIAGLIVVTYSLSETKELPMTIIGAVLGVAMTVFATFFLFKGQSKQQVAMINEELNQQKEVEIFKERLKAYNSFLDALRRYVTQPSPDGKKVVIFHTMAIRMHSNAEVSDLLDDNIVKLIKSTGSRTELKELVEALNAIACIFGNELYDKTMGRTKSVDAFVDAISGAQEEQPEEEKLIELAVEEKEDEAATNKATIIEWNDKLKSLKTQGWNYTPEDDAFILTSNSSPVKISVYRKKGKYIVEATKEGDSEFSQSLKDNFKGSRRYGTWWRELPINNYGVTEGTLLAQLPSNDKARASVIKWIDKLTGFQSVENINI
ncbi:MAG: hypothetical protein K2M93_02105 [Muribaculaceae bacterium]|nr:hypothetical protein [Muribaculaceae bacterium]